MKNYQTLLLVVLGIMITTSSFAQIPNIKRKLNPTDSLSIANPKPISLEEQLSAPFNELHKIYRYHDPILYIAIMPSFSSIKTRQVSLEDGEGKNGYWLEGNIAHRISAYRGKYYSPAPFRKLRVTFDAGFIIRMTKDQSSPLLPNNNSFGVGFDYLLSDVKKIEQTNKLISFVKIQIHHYSNGQAGTFFSNNITHRNNYTSGDFSSNYIQAVLTILKRTTGDHLLSAGFGYQHGIDFGGAFEMSKELRNSYGMNRLLMNLQWVRTPIYDLSVSKRKSTVVTSRQQISLRSEINYIADKNLSLYPLANKYRLGCRTYLTWMPWVTSDIGFVLNHYIGGDYLNIRYDDPINSAQVGLVMNFNK